MKNMIFLFIFGIFSVNAHAEVWGWQEFDQTKIKIAKQNAEGKPICLTRVGYINKQGVLDITKKKCVVNNYGKIIESESFEIFLPNTTTTEPVYLAQKVDLYIVNVTISDPALLDYKTAKNAGNPLLKGKNKYKRHSVMGIGGNTVILKYQLRFKPTFDEEIQIGSKKIKLSDLKAGQHNGKVRVTEETEYQIVINKDLNYISDKIRIYDNQGEALLTK